MGRRYFRATRHHDIHVSVSNEAPGHADVVRTRGAGGDDCDGGPEAIANRNISEIILMTLPGTKNGETRRSPLFIRVCGSDVAMPPIPEPMATPAIARFRNLRQPCVFHGLTGRDHSVLHENTDAPRFLPPCKRRAKALYRRCKLNAVVTHVEALMVAAPLFPARMPAHGHVEPEGRHP